MAVPLAGGVAWAVLSASRIAHWVARTKWKDVRRFAAVSGTILAVMSAGYGGNWKFPDLIFRLILSAYFVVVLYPLSLIVRRRVGTRRNSFSEGYIERE